MDEETNQKTSNGDWYDDSAARDLLDAEAALKDRLDHDQVDVEA